MNDKEVKQPYCWYGERLVWREDQTSHNIPLCQSCIQNKALTCFPGGSAGKESACNAGDLGSIPGLGRSPGEGMDYPLQYSGLENSMDCIVNGVAKSRTQLSKFHFHFDSSIPWCLREMRKLQKKSLKLANVVPEVDARSHLCNIKCKVKQKRWCSCCSVALCDSMDHSMPGFSVLHHLPELCHPLLLLPSIFPSIRVFSELALHIR